MNDVFSQISGIYGKSEAVAPQPDNSNDVFSQIKSVYTGGDNILPDPVSVTQAYGNYNPSVEVFNKGINRGVDLGAKEGTPVKLPKGNWEVLDAYNGAKNGYIGNNEGQGWGNSVYVKNADTGETLRFDHLSSETAQKGQKLTGGQIGLTGRTGNTTGPHLDLEYTDSNGNLGDVLKSRYARYLPVIQ